MGRPRKPRRRGRGEGTVFEKTITRTNKDGSKVTKVVWVAKTSGAYRKEFTGTTAAQAREARDAWLREHGRPVPRSQRAAPITVAQFAKVFLEHRERNRRPATYRDYENTFRNHIAPVIGHVRMHDLNDDQVRALYRQVEAEVSPSMAGRVHGTLRALLNYAIEGKVIRSTPLAVIRQDVPRWKRKPIHPLNEEQVEALFDACNDHRLGALFVLALDSGRDKVNCSAFNGTTWTLTGEPSMSNDRPLEVRKARAST